MSFLATALVSTVLVQSAVVASEETVPMLMPPLGFAAVAAGTFIVLGFVVWTYRDVANRHSRKTQGHDGSHGAGH